MSKRLTVLLCFAALLCMVASAADKRFTLVIDAGHGGSDAGAKGAISKEKDINLKVALAFGKLVERNCPDVKVIYTRKTDVFVPLHERANIANRNKADLFISIHTNALPKGKVARGIETYTLGMHRAAENFDVAKRENSVILFEENYEQHYEGFDPRSSESYIMFEFLQERNMAQSVELARYVQRRTCSQSGRANKGVKQAGFLVLRETSMPSCLVELGFITTRDEERYLCSSAGQEALGKGIYLAFVDYKAKYGGGVTATYKPETQPAAPASAPAAAKEQPAAEVKPTPAAQPQPAPAASVEADADDDVPVFKVQIMAGNSRVSLKDARFKGLESVECYEEGGLYKYTCGSTTDYNAANRTRRAVDGRFPGAFVVAFKKGEKVDVTEAIAEFKRNRNKR